MLPTAARLRAQPAIVKIRRVDALIIIAARCSTLSYYNYYYYYSSLRFLPRYYCYSLRAPINTAIVPSSP
jgi:hypothetical protein